MKTRLWSFYCLMAFLLASCSFTDAISEPKTKQLAEFTESYVHVSIELALVGEGQGSLLATFTPIEADAHLYSMRLPKEGINGLGRPTLIELPEGSQLHAAGELQESTPSTLDTVSPNVPALPVYPAGAVTLTLPVLLPMSGSTPINDEVLITYMACTPSGCHAPAIEKIVQIQIPGK